MDGDRVTDDLEGRIATFLRDAVIFDSYTDHAEHMAATFAPFVQAELDAVRENCERRIEAVGRSEVERVEAALVRAEEAEVAPRRALAQAWEEGFTLGYHRGKSKIYATYGANPYRD